MVPGSTTISVVASSLAELEHQASVAELVGAEQITLHGGGAQPSKAVALNRVRRLRSSGWRMACFDCRRAPAVTSLSRTTIAFTRSSICCPSARGWGCASSTTCITSDAIRTA